MANRNFVSSTNTRIAITTLNKEAYYVGVRTFFSYVNIVVRNPCIVLFDDEAFPSALHARQVLGNRPEDAKMRVLL